MQVGRLRPERYSADEVKLGVPYALALSSPAGIWMQRRAELNLWRCQIVDLL